MIPHPKLDVLLQALPPGRHAGGTLMVTAPGAHAAEMSRWLMGKTTGRVALGRSAFGDILVFRDLRERAREQGDPEAEEACDIALIDLNFKRMNVLAWSVEELIAALDDPAFQKESLRKELFDEVQARLGAPGDDEVYAFVPALALGGSETAGTVERQKWGPYQDLLFQL